MSKHQCPSDGVLRFIHVLHISIDLLLGYIAVHLIAILILNALENLRFLISGKHEHGLIDAKKRITWNLTDSVDVILTDISAELYFSSSEADCYSLAK